MVVVFAAIGIYLWVDAVRNAVGPEKIVPILIGTFCICCAVTYGKIASDQIQQSRQAPTPPKVVTQKDGREYYKISEVTDKQGHTYYLVPKTDRN